MKATHRIFVLCLAVAITASVVGGGSTDNKPLRHGGTGGCTPGVNC